MTKTFEIEINARTQHFFTMMSIQRDLESIQRSFKAATRKNSMVTDREFLFEIEPFTRDLHARVERSLALLREIEEGQ